MNPQRIQEHLHNEVPVAVRVLGGDVYRCMVRRCFQSCRKGIPTHWEVQVCDMATGRIMEVGPSQVLDTWIMYVRPDAPLPGDRYHANPGSAVADINTRLDALRLPLLDVSIQPKNHNPLSVPLKVSVQLLHLLLDEAETLKDILEASK